MALITRTSGVTVSVGGSAALLRAAPLPQRAARIAQDALRGEQDLRLVDSIRIKIPASAGQKSGRAAAPVSKVTIDVPLGPSEQAVILLEDHGKYRWVINGKALPLLAPTPGRAKASTVKRQTRFAIALRAGPPISAPAVKRTGTTRYGPTDKTVGKVIAYVFRFKVKGAGSQIKKSRRSVRKKSLTRSAASGAAISIGSSRHADTYFRKPRNPALGQSLRRSVRMAYSARKTADLALRSIAPRQRVASPAVAGNGGTGDGSGGGTRRRPNGGRAKARVECYFRAEMDQEVVVNKTVSVDVTVARRKLKVSAGRAGAAVAAQVEPDRKLIVQIAERRNFRVEGERRVEIDLPEPDAEANVSFDVTGLVAGEKGELWVQVRQGPVPLVTLKLEPHIVAKASAGPVARLPVEHLLAAMPTPEPPLDQLLITESLVGNRVQYHYFLDLPSLKIRTSFKSRLIQGRDSYINNILNRIGDAWAGTGSKQLAAFETDLKSIGAMMFTELMPREMQELLWDNRDGIRSVQVFSMEPFIPWELAYLKAPRSKVISEDSKFLGELGLVRWLYDGYPPVKLKLGSGGARYVIPTYSDDLELPDLGGEEKMMKKLFAATRVPARAFDLQQLMRTPGSFDLLHFAGHAEAAGAQKTDARLILDQTDDDTTENALLATTVSQIAQLDAKGRRPIVVLNACETARMSRSFASMGGFASAFVGGGVGVFIGTHWSVGDAPARVFIEHFYKAFAVRTPGSKRLKLSEAVMKARQAARLGGDATWLAYVVYGHPRAVVQ